MSEDEIGPLARRVVNRVSKVDLSRVKVKRRVITRVMEQFFSVLGLPWRPLHWAEDVRDGFEAACRGLSSIDQLGEALHEFLKRPSKAAIENRTWMLGWNAAHTAVRAGVWERTKRVVSAETDSLAERFIVADDDESRRLKAKAQSGSIWDEAIDVALNIPLVAASYAGYYGGGDAERTEHYSAVWGPFIDAYEAGLWLFWVNERETIIVPRPALSIEVREDGSSRLHSLTGPAIRYPDGTGHYFIHNVKVSPEIVETPAAQLDPHIIIEERNSEVRREMVRKIGIERICEALKAECVDRWNDYELLLLDLRDGRLRPFLKMKNPSIGVYHIEGVAPECRTVAEALRWRNETDVPPAVLT